MSIKAVLNSAGKCVAFGPNDSNYEPGIPEGGTLTILPDANDPRVLLHLAELQAVSRVPDPIDELRTAMKADPTLLDRLKAK